MVNISSDAARVGSSGESIYSACKGGTITAWGLMSGAANGLPGGYGFAYSTNTLLPPLMIQ